jgi:hypothetical protein
LVTTPTERSSAAFSASFSGTWITFSTPLLPSTAGTPTNSPVVAGQFVLCWPSVSGRTYAVMMATNLMAGFSNLATNIPATPPMNVHTDTVDNVPARFYRVKVE